MGIIPTNAILNTGMYNFNIIIIIHCGLLNRSLSILFTDSNQL